MQISLEQIFAALFHHRLRSLLIILSIAIGAASVTAVGSIAQLGQAAVSREISSMGGDSLMVSAESEQYPQTSLGERELSLIRNGEGVLHAAPVTVFYANASMCGLEGLSTIWGVDSAAQNVVSIETIHGRFLSAEDVAASSYVCVVDEKTARAFYQRSNIVGKTLSLELESGQVDLTIVGVVRSGGSIMQDVMNDYIPFFIYLPYTTVLETTGRNDFDHILIETAQGVDREKIGQQLTTALATSSGGSREQYHTDSLARQREQLDAIMNIVTLALSGIAAISLLVAGLGVMTVMLVTVQERTREIGIKKALGAKNRTILQEFLIEAFIISLMGSILGLTIGLLSIFLLCSILQCTININWTLLFVCFMLTNGIGCLSGVIPAWTASRLRPVDAICFNV